MDHFNVESNGMARCGICGEPSVPVMVGTPAEVEANPNLIVRCLACAATEAAEAITAGSAREQS